MAIWSHFLRRFGVGRPGSGAPDRARLALEKLEDRCVPTVGWSSMTSNFNNVPIGAGNTIWFSSSFKATNLGTGPATVYFTAQTITFTAGGTNYSVAVPDAAITFSTGTTAAGTTFDAAA